MKTVSHTLRDENFVSIPQSAFFILFQRSYEIILRFESAEKYHSCSSILYFEGRFYRQNVFPHGLPDTRNADVKGNRLFRVFSTSKNNFSGTDILGTFLSVSSFSLGRIYSRTQTTFEKTI